MKFIWMLLIGMLLFNGFILAFSVFFAMSPYSTGLYNVENVTGNEALNAYKTPGILSFNTIGIGFVGILGVGAIVTLLTRNLQYIAAGALVALISSLWTVSASVFSDMANTYTVNGISVVGSIYTIISIAIGIMVAILILGIFTGQEQLTW
jgi:hypothetical protein